jgi:hypothetical protein
VAILIIELRKTKEANKPIGEKAKMIS